jgi:P-type Ca2+ transporter type 2C
VAAQPAQAAGLTADAAAQRLKTDGFNELPSPDRRSFVRILLEVAREPMFALLIGGGLVYLLLGDRAEALLLLAFACLSVVITIVQESRSERVLETLRNLASPRALVVRDGNRIYIPGREVVRGDLIILSEGDRVAADATLIASHDLLADESLLTGESVAVRKAVPAQLPEHVDSSAAPSAGGDDLPYLFAGTLIVRGTGQACVHATGIQTEMGKIGKAIRDIETEQPHLRKQMRNFVRTFAAIGAIAGGAVVLLYGLFRGSWLDALLSGIAIGMSLLHEEFALVTTVFMAMGAWRISRARVLTRRASAIETLGATTVLCTDKTGTLTENRMSVTAIRSIKEQWDQNPGAALSTGVLDVLSVAQLATQPNPSDPMDIAVQKLAAAHGITHPVTSGAATLLHAYGLRPEFFAVANVIALEDNAAVGTHDGSVAYAKGAVEAIAELCGLSGATLQAIEAQANRLAADGVRVLGVAKTAPLPAADARDLPESLRALPFEYYGLIGLADPLRPTAAAAVAECRSAGVKVVMVTGDYPATALAIARSAGLAATTALAGEEMARMQDDQLRARMHSPPVFARIPPIQKLRIVESFKANGEIVAMTGDGVNDAPAIKAAHIGIAMGARGTDVAREAAAIVLLDDDFNSIVKTIRLGRRIYDNLRKAIEFIVAVHIPIAGLALLPLLFGLPLVLTPVHIAFLEMVVDPACSIVFEAEEEEQDIMQRPPRNPASPLLERRRIAWAALQGTMACAILGGVLVYATFNGMPEQQVRALAFTSLVLISVGFIFVNRSFSASLGKALLRPNKFLWILLTGVAAVLAVTLYWPPASALFRFGALQWQEWIICACAGVSNVLLLEAVKSKWFRI